MRQFVLRVDQGGAAAADTVHALGDQNVSRCSAGTPSWSNVSALQHRPLRGPESVQVGRG
jgi:hypothetical protein